MTERLSQGLQLEGAVIVLCSALFLAVSTSSRNPDASADCSTETLAGARHDGRSRAGGGAVISVHAAIIASGRAPSSPSSAGVINGESVDRVHHTSSPFHPTVIHLEIFNVNFLMKM